MKIPKDLTERFKKVQDRGDIAKLTKLFGYSSKSNTSSVINGNADTTISKAEKFKRFIEAKEARVRALTETDAV